VSDDQPAASDAVQPSQGEAPEPLGSAHVPGGMPRLLRLRGKAVDSLRGLASIAIAMLLWEVVRALGILSPTYAPSTVRIFATLLSEMKNGPLPGAVFVTMQAWALGLALATAVAIPAGFAIGLSRWIEAGSRVLVEFLRPIPSVAIIPVAILFAGIGLKMKLFIIVFACFWPILFNTIYGIGHVDPLLLETGRSFGLRRTALVLRVVVPSALPSVATGLSVAASVALILTVIGEMVAGGDGLGFYILAAGFGGQVVLTYAGMVAAGLLGWILNVGILGLRRHLLAWSREGVT